MKHFTFTGGIHPHETHGGKRVTGGVPVKDALPPATVAISLSQHVGAPCRCLVKPGDRVLMGQKIGEPVSYVGAPVHSSVSGVVKGLHTRTAASGARVDCVIIENDGLDEKAEPLKTFVDPLVADPKELLEAVREAGLVGLGGAAFPLQVKLSPPEDRKIDYLLINGAECEPYLTSDHRMMVEHPEKVIDGARIAAHILGAYTVRVGIETNKPDAIQKMKKAAAGMAVEICPLKVKYPQGGEKQIIKALTGQEVPSGGLPMDVGCVVMNVSTAASLSTAMRQGEPVTSRIVTVTGAVNQPCNLNARIGTDIASLIEQAGGAKEGVDRVILGGPMMGMSAYNMNTPTMKATGGILLTRSKDEGYRPPQSCIHCGSCVQACPMGLMPLLLYRLAKQERFKEAAERECAMDCIECGSCAYECPAKLPIVHMIRTVKREVKRR